MQRKGYDILSWIFLVVIIILFAYNLYLVNSASSGLFDGYKATIESGNFSEMKEMRENTRNAMLTNDVSGKINQVNILKYALYGLGIIYSVIIFILCFRLKTGTFVKLVVLIGGILTYGGLAVLTYFFDVRKNFSSSDS